MSYKVEMGGLTVICDTPADVAALVAHLGNTAKSPANDPDIHITHGQGVLRNIVSRLPPNARTVLLTLVQAEGNRATPAKLREAVGVDSNIALAGITSAITREAKKSHVKTDYFFKKVVGDDRERTVEYVIPSHAVSDVRAALNGYRSNN